MSYRGYVSSDLLDKKLNITKGHIEVIRMMHERFGISAKEIKRHFYTKLWDYRFIQSILDYKLWPEIKPRGFKAAPKPEKAGSND